MRARIKTMPFLWMGRFNGITIAPYIFIYKNAYGGRGRRFLQFLNHEKIHIRQVEDEIEKHKKYVWILGNVTGWIAFYAKYLTEFAINIKKYGKAAYRNISYEREAYANEAYLTYLEYREPFEYLKYKDGYVCPHKNKKFLYNDNRVEGQKWYQCPDCSSMINEKS